MQPAPAPADLFGAEPAANEAGATRRNRLALTGILVHAEVRRKPGPRGFLPVLCMEIEDVGTGHHTVYAEHAYTEATLKEAESWAKRLHKGLRITVSTDLVDLRLTLPAADFAIDPPTTEEPTP
jgi:hypothetical protein